MLQVIFIFGGFGSGHHLALLLIAIAFVEATRNRAVFFPVTHAHPTKFVIAGRTDHMITAVILFNPRFAFGAFPRIRDDPLRVFAFSAALLYPGFE